MDTEHIGFLALGKWLTNQFVIQTNAAAAIRVPEQQVYKAHTVAPSNNKEITPRVTPLLRVHTSYIWVQFFAHITFVVNHTINVTPRGGSKTIQCQCETGFLLKVHLKLMMSQFAATIYFTLV